MRLSRFSQLLYVVTCAFVVSAVPATADREPLQGGVDETAPLEPTKSPGLSGMEPMIAPVVPARPKKLQGNVEQQAKKPLQGNADDEEAGQLTPMTPQSDRNAPLKGNAAMDANGLNKQDPDADDQELMVQWDKWRNRFLSAVQSNMQEELNNPDDSMLRWDPGKQMVMARFPMGTTAWFKVQITVDKHIVNYSLYRSSGFPNFDKAVSNAVKNMDGSALLKFPGRSRRQVVTQIAGIKTSDTDERPNFHFGDTERYTIPGN